MYIGSRRLDDRVQTDCSKYRSSILWITPDWDNGHVRRAASENYASFTNFLKEAIKSAEIRLSDSEGAEVFNAIKYVLEKPYF